MSTNLNTILTIELIPSTCHFSNVRTTVRTKDWNKIRFISYELAENKCEICGDIGKNQGYKHNLECHEIWEYDDENNIQKLIGLISLCVKCHQVKHIGRAIAMGKEDEAIAHLMKVNNWTLEQASKHISESFETHKQRSQFNWKLDLSILKEKPYFIEINSTGKRKFKITRYRKKRRHKCKKKKIGRRPPKRLA